MFDDDLEHTYNPTCRFQFLFSSRCFGFSGVFGVLHFFTFFSARVFCMRFADVGRLRKFAAFCIKKWVKTLNYFFVGPVGSSRYVYIHIQHHNVA